MSLLTFSACQNGYRFQHVLIRVLEEWKEYFNDNEMVRVVLTELSKAFSCALHDRSIAKLAVYNISTNLPT